MRRIVILAAVLALSAVGCTDDSEQQAATSAPSITTEAPTTTSAPASTTTDPPTTTAVPPPATTTTMATPPVLAVPAANRGTWQSWSRSNYLAVRGLTIAPNQDVWAITPDGVVHWDRSGSYTEATDPAWPDPAPWSLVFTPDGARWLGFETAIVRVAADGSSTQYEFPPTGSDWDSIKLAVGPDGRVWAASHLIGVQRFDGDGWRTVVADPPGRGDIDTLAVDSTGNPWFGSYWSGLWQLEDGELRRETGQTTRVVAAATDGDVWYAADEGHVENTIVVHIDSATGTRTEYPLGEAVAWDIAPTDDAAFVATNPRSEDGTHWYGLWHLAEGRIQPIAGGWDELQRQILGVAVDAGGGVWLGGHDGVWYYDGTADHQYRTDTFAGFSIDFITPGADGELIWSGDCSNSSVYDGTHWSDLSTAPEQLNWCDDTLVDDAGRFWIAGEGGLARLDGDEWITFDRDASGVAWHDMYPPCGGEACDDPHWSLAASGDVWAGMIGVENGLWRFQNGAWQPVADALPAGSGGVAEVAAAADDTLWVATSNGVHHLAAGRWVSSPSGDDGPPADIRSIATGGDAVWVASYDEIARFDGGTWTRYPRQDDWYDYRILMVDPEGEAWLATSNGAKRFDGTVITGFELPGSGNRYVPFVIDQAGSWWIAGGGRLYRWTP